MRLQMIALATKVANGPGDGLGSDVLPFGSRVGEILIEVTTTRRARFPLPDPPQPSRAQCRGFGLVRALPRVRFCTNPQQGVSVSEVPPRPRQVR